jgi:hypothetical protein
MDFGFDAGTLTCTASCILDTEGCYSCGDGIKQGSETCDGSELGGQTCISQGYGPGTLACNADCQSFDTSGCSPCGNGTIDQGEQCDGNDFGGETCKSQGFDEGQLACTAQCTLDTSSCSYDCGAPGDFCVYGSDCCSGECDFVSCL